jgi:Mitochondrial carrier protein
MMGITETQSATWTQDAVSSCLGAIASITVAQPLDVIKTRVQNRPFNSPESGVSIVTKLIRTEGLSAFFKGLTPKLLVVGPKLVFSFTIAQHTIAYFSNKH